MTPATGAFSAVDVAAAAVRTLAPYVPGKPIAELEREYGVRDSIKLASNENPLGPGPLALAAIARAAAEVGLYPDGNGFELKQALAQRYGCAMDMITLGNGSNDLLVLMAEAFLSVGTEAIVSQYAFAIYGIAVQATGATLRLAPAYPEGHPMALGHDLEAMAALINERTRLIYVANPNNPTGSWVNAAALRKFIASVPRSAVVLVDEAYIEYVDDENFPSTPHWLSEFPNLVVTRTFSKAYGLAGLRVGYALAHPTIGNVLNRVRQPFNVNLIALSAACAALDDHEHLKRSVAANREGMRQVQVALDRLGVKHYSSVGNFLLVDCGRPGGAVYESMLRQGVIVRPVGGYGLTNHLRITIGTAEQNRRMLDALQQSLKQAP